MAVPASYKRYALHWYSHQAVISLFIDPGVRLAYSRIPKYLRMKTCWIFLAVFSASALYSQNLIPNPGFEIYTSCPGIPNILEYRIELAPPWTTPTSSSDYYHQCGNLWSGVPQNFAGFEYAHSGQGYGGFLLFGSDPFPDNQELVSREYLEVPLIHPLSRDSVYQLELYLSLSDSSIVTTDQFEVVFTNFLLQIPPHPIYYTSSLAFYRSANLYNKPGNVIDNKNGWKSLKWLYRAKGGEGYMTMGIFKREWEITSINTGSGSSVCYVYIDDVSLEPASVSAVELGVQGDLIVCDSVGVFELSVTSSLHSDFLWSTGDTTRSITVNRPGKYAVWANYGEGYLWHDTIEVVYRPMPVLDVGPDTVICAGSLPLTLAAAEGMDAWQWNTGDTLRELVVSEPGVYHVRTTHFCGEQRDTIQIALFDIPALELGPDTTICGEAPIAVELQAPYRDYIVYSWSNGSTSPELIAETPGLWHLRMEHPCGVLADSVFIRRQPLLSLEIPSDTAFCAGRPLQIAAAAGFDSYQWSTGVGRAEAVISTSGVYWVRGEYVCGVVSDTLRVTQAPPLRVELPAQVEAYLGEEVLLRPLITGGPVGHIRWTPDTWLNCAVCEEVVATATNSTLYSVNVEDVWGCSAEAAVRLVVSERRRWFVPDAFSPNDDGINDRLTVFAGPEVREIRWLRVFDRWGGMVFERRNFPPNSEAAGWDGTRLRQQAAAGVYVFSAELELVNGTIMQVHGEVTLLR